MRDRFGGGKQKRSSFRKLALATAVDCCCWRVQRNYLQRSRHDLSHEHAKAIKQPPQPPPPPPSQRQEQEPRPSRHAHHTQATTNTKTGAARVHNSQHTCCHISSAHLAAGSLYVPVLKQPPMHVRDHLLARDEVPHTVARQDQERVVRANRNLRATKGYTARRWTK